MKQSSSARSWLAAEPVMTAASQRGLMEELPVKNCIKMKDSSTTEDFVTLNFSTKCLSMSSIRVKIYEDKVIKLAGTSSKLKSNKLI
jgi:hypothetical protein